jgi:hypothetical protein
MVSNISKDYNRMLKMPCWWIRQHYLLSLCDLFIDQRYEEFISEIRERLELKLKGKCIEKYRE